MAPNSTEHENLTESDDRNNGQLIKRKESEGEFLSKTSLLLINPLSD